MTLRRFLSTDFPARALQTKRERYSAPVCSNSYLAAREITFGPREFDKRIRVDIMNDYCHERYGEFFRIQLFVPGGGPLIGEQYSTVVRIDDDDKKHLVNELNVDYCHYEG